MAAYLVAVVATLYCAMGLRRTIPTVVTASGQVRHVMAIPQTWLIYLSVAESCVWSLSVLCEDVKCSLNCSLTTNFLCLDCVSEHAAGRLRTWRGNG